MRVGEARIEGGSPDDLSTGGYESELGDLRGEGLAAAPGFQRFRKPTHVHFDDRSLGHDPELSVLQEEEVSGRARDACARRTNHRGLGVLLDADDGELEGRLEFGWERGRLASTWWREWRISTHDVSRWPS